jgi:hypothetical protein
MKNDDFVEWWLTTSCGIELSEKYSHFFDVKYSQFFDVRKRH